jgi:hypothetical protein
MSLEWFGLLTESIRRKAKSKADQVSGYPIPRVLCIVTEHQNEMVMGPLAARGLLTGRVSVGVPLAGGDPSTVSTPSSAVFLGSDGDSRLVPVRRSISAIVLVSASESNFSSLGVLHPDAAHPFDPSAFEGMHFARLRWPISNGTIHVEWVGPDPEPLWRCHLPVRLEDAELR